LKKYHNELNTTVQFNGITSTLESNVVLVSS